jgi:septum formation protein
MPPPRLILGSGSPQRRRLLADAGYEFDVIAPRDSVECGICSTGGPAGLVVELAVSKALDVAAQLKDHAAGQGAAVILACDTVAECRGEVLGKPHDEAHARSMLERLRGNLHRVYSGVCVWRPAALAANDKPGVRLAVSELFMDEIADAELEDYLASGLWQGKAGAFGYQDRIGWLRLNRGTESNVIGLPMELVPEMLAAHGVHPSQR